MANAELNIVLKLVDNATASIKKSLAQTSEAFNAVNASTKSFSTSINQAFQNISAGLKKASDEVQKFGRIMMSVGHQVSRIGTTFTIIGGAITAFFVKALSEGSKQSLIIERSINNFNEQLTILYATIASSVLPVVKNLTAFLSQLNLIIERIPQPLRDQIIQFSFLAGILATVGGLLISLVGRLLSTAGSILQLSSRLLTLNPVITIVIASIASIIVLMFKFEDTTKKILNGMQSFFLALKQGFFQIKSALEDFIASGLESLSVMYEHLAKLPGPLKTFYQEATIGALQAANTMRKFSNEDIVNAQVAAIQLKEIMMNKDGTWAKGFDDVRTKIEQLIKFIPNLATTTQKTVEVAKLSFAQLTSGLQQGFAALSSSLNQAATQWKSFGSAAKAVAISLAIVTTAAGIARALQDYPWPFSIVVGSLVAAAGALQIATIAAQKFHSGGIIKAHSGLAIDEVPIIAQTGEGVLSRKGMATLGGSRELNRLNSGESVGNNNNIYVTVNYPKMSSKEEVETLARALGFEIEKQMRYARTI